jgi:hypothetical protein
MAIKTTHAIELERWVGYLASAKRLPLSDDDVIKAVTSILFDRFCEEVLSRLRADPGREAYITLDMTQRHDRILAVAASLGAADMTVAEDAQTVSWIEGFMLRHDRKPIPLQARWELLARPYVCAAGGCSKKERLEIDHFIPVKRGGSSDITNLRWLCRAHNASKSARIDRIEI